MSELRQWHERSILVERMLSLLHLLAAHAMLYKDDHPKFRATLDHVKGEINRVIGEEQRIEIKLIHHRLVYENHELQNHLATTEAFRVGMEERGIESLIFLPGITVDELVEYAHFMRISIQKVHEMGDLGQHLRDQGVRHIRIARLVGLRRVTDDQQQMRDVSRGLAMLLRNIQNFRKDKLRIIDDMHNEARVARVVNVDAARHIVEQCLSQSVESSVTLLALNAVRSADSYTSTHSLNTCTLSLCFARYLGLDDDLLPEIGVACLLHDIGKMFVPEEVLNKPGRLTPEEWVVMENHTTYGARFLLGIPNLPRIAPLVAYEHHMQYDLSGYPRVYADYRVNIASLIATLADFYDALTTTRPYKRAMPPQDAVRLMSEMHDSKMEPRLKNLFLRMLGPYPIGTTLRLNDGSIAVVSAPNPETPERPVAGVVIDAQGNRLEVCVPVDLAEKDEDTGIWRSGIAEALDPEDFDISPVDVLQDLVVANRPMAGD